MQKRLIAIFAAVSLCGITLAAKQKEEKKFDNIADMQKFYYELGERNAKIKYYK